MKRDYLKNSQLLRTAILFVFVLCVFSVAKADNITLASVGTAADAGQTNSNGATIAIAPNSLWAAALPGSSWVSYASTGSTTAAGFLVVANGTVVNFSDVFNVSGTPTGGSISVLADDSAAVYLNGVLLQAEAPSAGNKYAICSDFGIGCLVATTINLPASDLNEGSNTLVFAVAQRNGVSFGLDYAGFVTDPSTTVPEPGMALLMMLGLVSVGGASFFRKTGRSFEHEEPMRHDSDIPSTFFKTSRVNPVPSNELDEFEIRRRAFFS
jgi:hypothetical protein